MTIKKDNSVLQIKPKDVNFIITFDIRSYDKQYNNQNIILVIDFNLTDILDDWMIALKNKSFIFVPTLKEAIDYIGLERINKDLGL